MILIFNFFFFLLIYRHLKNNDIKKLPSELFNLINLETL